MSNKKQARVKVPNTMSLVEAGSICGQTAGHANIERFSIQMGLEDNDLENKMVTLIINEEE